MDPQIEVDVRPAPASTATTATPRPTTIQDFVTKDEVLKAEILWALHVIESHQSYRSCQGIGTLFHRMFPDSGIASQFQCAEKKASYLNVFGLAPHFKALLKQKVNSSYVLLFDESLNKKNQKKQMDFYIRIWDNDEVKSRYLDSKFVGHCTADDMREEFNTVLEGLNPRNLIQISMDGPSVNWKFHRSMQSQMETNYGKSLLDVGSCGLHILHGAFQTGVEKSEIGISSLLRALYTLFHDSPARREDYLRVTDGTKLPLKFCKTRWLDNSTCAQRAIEIWDSVCKYVGEVGKESVPNPDNQSFSSVKKFVQTPLTLARLKFFFAVSQEILPFLTSYQDERPLFPFISLDLHELILSLLQRFVKHSVTEPLTPVKLPSFDVRKDDSYADLSKIDIGLAADKALKEAVRSKKASDRAVFEFHNECRWLLVELVSKLIEKAPIKYALARHLACLDPRHFNEKEIAIRYMRRTVSALCDAKWITPENGDETVRQYSRYLTDASVKHAHFDRKKDRLDHLWHADIAKKPEFSNLWEVVRQLLLLSHGQATVERGFSINKEIEVDNLRDESSIAQRVICDHLHNVGGLQKVELDKKLLLSASAARRKYQDYLDEQKRNKQLASVSDRKRKIEE